MRQQQITDPADLDYRRAEEVSTAWLRKYAYEHGDAIYRFMDKYQIGKSAYGQLMDKAATGKHVVRHRLFGHHIVYDCPLNDPTHIWDFIEHDLSDLFTKQGLPILPGEMLKNNGLLTYCDGLGKSWNFLNGFDILSGVVTIQSAVKSLRSSFNRDFAIDTLGDFAKTFGVGALELAIAFSSANPLLLISAVMELTSAVRAFANDSCVIYMNAQQTGLHVEFSLDCASVEAALLQHQVSSQIDSLSVERAIDIASKMSWE